MQNEDDFGEIPAIVPDRDDLQSQRSHVSATSPVPPTAGKVPREAVVSRTQASAPPVRRSSNGLLWLFFLITIGGASFTGWWIYERLIDMEFMLDASRSELNHARKRLGELEALVVATDVNANKSGTVVQAQVKLLSDRAKEREKLIDSEIEKLWGITYNTNKPLIEETEKEVDNIAVSAQQNADQLEAVAAQLSAQQQQIATLIDTEQALSNTLTSQQSVLDDQQKMQVSQAGSIASQTKAMQDVELLVSQVSDAVAKMQNQLSRLISENKGLQASISSTSKAPDLSGVEMQIARLRQQVTDLRAQQSETSVIEHSASELEERLFIAEQDVQSIISFRQDTNRKLSQLEQQIRELKFGN